MSSIIDSYSEINQDSDVILYRQDEKNGQSFEGDGKILDSVKFYIKKVGSPSFDFHADIYAHTGTYGTSSEGTGSPLATSDNVNASSISTSYSLITFEFTGANKIVLTNGTKYVVVADHPSSTDYTNRLVFGYDGSSPSHGGNLTFYDPDYADWFYNNARDICFYVYGDDATSIKDLIQPGIIVAPR